MFWGSLSACMGTLLFETMRSQIPMEKRQTGQRKKPLDKRPAPRIRSCCGQGMNHQPGKEGGGTQDGPFVFIPKHRALTGVREKPGAEKILRRGVPLLRMTERAPYPNTRGTDSLSHASRASSLEKGAFGERKCRTQKGRPFVFCGGMLSVVVYVGAAGLSGDRAL